MVPTDGLDIYFIRMSYENIVTIHNICFTFPLEKLQLGIRNSLRIKTQV